MVIIVMIGSVTNFVQFLTLQEKGSTNLKIFNSWTALAAAQDKPRALEKI